MLCKKNVSLILNKITILIAEFLLLGRTIADRYGGR